MTMDAAQIQRTLLATFLEESFDGLERLEAGLLQLEDGAVSSELIDDLFRVVHSMKGGAGAIGVSEVGSLAHVMENVLDALRRGEPAEPDTASMLLRGVDALRGSLRARQAGHSVAADANAEITAAIERHASRSKAPLQAAPRAAPAARWIIDLTPQRTMMRNGTDPGALLRGLAALGEVETEVGLAALPAIEQLDPTECYLRWRIAVDGQVDRAALDDLFGWVDGQCDVVIEREVAAAVTPAVEARPAATVTATATATATVTVTAASAAMSSIRVGIDKIDLLMNMVGELVITQSMLGELDGDGALDAGRIARLREGLGQLARNTRALQDSVMQLRSMPISTVFNRFPRLVRDLGERLGKEITLEITGQGTELDKAVLEKLGDPLVHLIRNSIDHGIEPIADRIAAGKPRAGTIRLHAEHRGGDVIVEVSDDGKGLDPERILAAARQRGLVAVDAVIDEPTATQLVFLPGFSTAREVSDVSGRGVGMDVVRRHVKDLGGDITLKSQRGAGVQITLRLPLTLAIIDGQLIRLGVHQFVIPLLSITESVAIEAQRKRRLGGICDVYRLRDQLIPMIDLAALLGMPASPPDDRRVMVVVAADGAQLGLVVDELMAQQQVVVKSLETNYQRVPGLAGATILGDGRVAFILDVIALGQAAQLQPKAA